MNYVNNVITDIKLVIKQMILNFKFLFRNPINLLLLLSFTLLALSISIVFMPIDMAFNIIILISTIMPLGLIYASISYEWRKSTLYNNLLKTKNNKFLYNIAVMGTMMIFCFIITIFVLFVFFIMNYFSMIKTSWNDYGGRDEFSLLSSQFEWGILVYTQIVNVIWMFAIGFFFQSFIKAQNAFYVSIMSMTILMIIFGGSINDNFDWNAYSENGSVPKFHAAITPDYLYFISIFIPFYSTGQILQFAVDGSQQSSAEIIGKHTWVWLTSDIIPDVADWRGSANKWVGLWTWNILWIMPWIQIFSFGVISMFIRKKLK